MFWHSTGTGQAVVHKSGWNPALMVLAYPWGLYIDQLTTNAMSEKESQDDLEAHDKSRGV